MGKIMKNIFKYSILLTLCSLVGLVSCTHEELSTDQFSDDAVVFGAFAPNPVVRGAELRIMGSNLDKVVEVQIPGSEPITDIEVISSGRVSEIRVVTPAAGAEDASVTGPVTEAASAPAEGVMTRISLILPEETTSISVIGSEPGICTSTILSRLLPLMRSSAPRTTGFGANALNTTVSSAN